MALINCPECAHTISNQSESCPHCGFPINRHNLTLPSPIQAPVSLYPLPKPSRNNAIYTLLGLGICVLLSIILLSTCSSNKNQRTETNTTHKSVTTRSTQNTQVNPDTSALTPIPMPLSGSPENGRYFLISHRNDQGIHDIEYLRTKNNAIPDQTVTYGRMQINCPAHKIRKYTSDTPEDLVNADLGKWYTPIPDWTDQDIVNFICRYETIVASQDSTSQRDSADNSQDTLPTDSADENVDAQDNISEPVADASQNEVTSSDEVKQPEQTEAAEPTPKADVKTEPAPNNAPANPPPLPEARPSNTAHLEAQKAQYTNQIAAIIKANWKLPIAPKFNTVRASFTISPNGTIGNIQVNSDDMYANASLTQAIRASSPLPPIPNGLENEFAHNTMTFRIK